jgi:hypothetical protein
MIFEQVLHHGSETAKLITFECFHALGKQRNASGETLESVRHCAQNRHVVNSLDLQVTILETHPLGGGVFDYDHRYFLALSLPVRWHL